MFVEAIVYNVIYAMESERDRRVMYSMPSYKYYYYFILFPLYFILYAEAKQLLKTLPSLQHFNKTLKMLCMYIVQLPTMRNCTAKRGMQTCNLF